MPVLIVLLFYIYDLVKIKRYYLQIEFVGQQMANMIQNISQKRENKIIKKEDLINIHVLAWQSICPGKSLFLTNSKYPMGYRPGTAIVYVKGLDSVVIRFMIY